MKSTQSVVLPKELVQACKRAAGPKYLTISAYIKTAILEALARDGVTIKKFGG